jgi:hypothetical protein
VDDPRPKDEAAGDRSPSQSSEKAKQERKLDKAVADTFPASDPIAPGHPTGDEDDEPRRPVDRKPPLLDVELVKELARKLRRKTGM